MEVQPDLQPAAQADIAADASQDSLTPAQQQQIALYLNFDMVGSPNHVFFIYDGDNSDAVGAGPGPDGSAQIEKTFERFYTERGIPFKGTDFTGRSDYGRFIAVGIPAGGLFTGAEGVKSAAEAATWGGTAGQQYDPCYHLACDTFANNSNAALDTNSDAIAYATLQYAMSTADVNGAKGKGSIGERANGYLGVVKPPNAGATELVERVNAQRRRFYTRVATQNGAKLADVEKLAGANRLLEASPGEWIQPPNESWILKEDDTVVTIDG